MAGSDVDLCNIALGKIGAAVITSLTQDSKSARACNEHFNHIRDLVLREHDWNCASLYASIAALADTPIPDDWDYQYVLPVDPYCLSLREMPDAKVAPYRVVGRKLYTNESSPVTIRYTQRMTNVAEMDPLLAEAVACKLGMQIGYDLTHSVSIANRMEDQYDTALMNAIDANVIEVNAEYTITSPAERDAAVMTNSWDKTGR